MFYYTVGGVEVKEFYYDGEPFTLPAYTKMIHDGKVWGLYVNELLDVSFIVTRGVLDGVKGWRVMTTPGIVNVSYAGEYVKQKCGECLGMR